MPTQSRKRLEVACIVALGFACLSIALGLLYFDWMAQERARHEIELRGKQLSSTEQDVLLDAWKMQKYGVPALVFGTAGAALVGGGLVLGVFEFRKSA